MFVLVEILTSIVLLPVVVVLLPLLVLPVLLFPVVESIITVLFTFASLI